MERRAHREKGGGEKEIKGKDKEVWGVNWERDGGSGTGVSFRPRSLVMSLSEVDFT